MTDTTTAAADTSAPVTTASPEATSTTLGDVLKAAETKVIDVAEQAKKAVAEALNDGAEAIGLKPPFSTHSDTLVGELVSKAEGYKRMVADIDAKLDQLTAERNDLLKAYQMLSAAISAQSEAGNA